MIEIHRNALVLASAEHLYNLINDIESYPLFLDGVKAAHVLECSEQHMLGKIVISKAGIEKELITRNQLVYPSRIEMSLEKGPLEYLSGTWSIKALGDEGCKVSLDLRFHAEKSIKGMAFGMMFKKIADQMVAAFVARAQADNPVGKR
jgi:ribosome-associated toxin RatA of RatAB toxin-antitoxin module